MWLAERDACSEARATIRMSRYSLYTAVRRRGGAPGRPLHRSAPPASRDPDRAPNRMCVRRVCAVGVRPLVAPSLGIRANSGLSSGRCRARARAPRGRVAGTYTGCTLVDATDGTRAMVNGRVAGRGPILVVAMAARRFELVGWRGVTAAYRLSLIPAIERKNSTLSHIAPRGEPLSFLRRSVMTSRVRCHPTRHASCSMSIASSLSHLEPNRTSLASTVTPGVLFSFLRNKRLASSLSP